MFLLNFAIGLALVVLALLLHNVGHVIQVLARNYLGLPVINLALPATEKPSQV
jgi:hypothetical protein